MGEGRVVGGIDNGFRGVGNSKFVNEVKSRHCRTQIGVAVGHRGDLGVSMKANTALLFSDPFLSSVGHQWPHMWLHCCVVLLDFCVAVGKRSVSGAFERSLW